MKHNTTIKNFNVNLFRTKISIWTTPFRSIFFFIKTLTPSNCIFFSQLDFPFSFPHKRFVFLLLLLNYLIPFRCLFFYDTTLKFKSFWNKCKKLWLWDISHWIYYLWFENADKLHVNVRVVSDPKTDWFCSHWYMVSYKTKVLI